MSLGGHLWLLAARVLIGAMAASVIGLILTGDVGYILILSFGIPVGIFTIAMVGSALTKARRAAGGSRRRVGVIRTVGQGARQVVTAAGSVPGAEAATLATGADAAVAPIDPPPPGRPPVLAQIANRVVAFAPIAIAFVLVLVPSAEMIGWSVTDAVAGRPFDGKDMRVGLHQQDAVNDLFDVIGSSEIYDIYFFDSYIIADAPTTPGAQTSDEYEWQGGHAFRNGPELIQPDKGSATIDASRIDFSMLADLVRKTEADTGWSGFTEYYPAIYSFAGEPPEISIHVATDYYNATYTYDLNGKFLGKTGSGVDDSGDTGN